jgi:glutamine synthetase
MSNPKSVIEMARKRQFLLKGDVFTADFLEMWIGAKHQEAHALRPHPYELCLYYYV